MYTLATEPPIEDQAGSLFTPVQVTNAQRTVLGAQNYIVTIMGKIIVVQEYT